MQQIHGFRRKNDDTSHTMYTRFARFVRESGGVFAKSPLVKLFLSKIDKRLLELALPMIIIEFGGRTTLAEAFASFFTLDYMFGVSGQVGSSAAVTCAQIVSRATSPTTGDSLRARDNGPMA